MEFNEMLISTGVDALIKIIREKNRVEITLASRLLNIPVSTIEEWSHALEDEGIITIEYQLTKVYLKWVAPTEEKVTEERQALAEGKSALVAQVREAEARAKSQAEEVRKLKDEFTLNYGKIMARIEELGGKSASVQGLKSGSEENYYKVVDAIGELKGKLNETSESIAAMKGQLEKTRADLSGFNIKESVARLGDARGRVSTLRKELDSMDKEVEKSLGLLASGSMGAPEIQKNFKSIRDEFSGLGKKMDNEFKLSRDADSAYEKLEAVKKGLAAVHASAKDAAEKLEGLSGTVPQIEKKAAALSALVGEDSRQLKQLTAESREIEAAFSRVKLDKDVKGRLEEMAESRKALEKKMDGLRSAVEESLPAFENVDQLIATLSELRKRIAAERKRLAEESGAIFSSLDEEVATYSTFQKIKEKADGRIADYLKQLERMEADYEKVTKEAEKAERDFDAAFSKFRESGEFEKAGELSKFMDGLAEKKRSLEEVKAGVDALEAASARISKQLNLLTKESELLDIRASSVGMGGTVNTQVAESSGRAGQELRESIALTENEQKDFDVKREELRRLIKKLWEEE